MDNLVAAKPHLIARLRAEKKALYHCRTMYSRRDSHVEGKKMMYTWWTKATVDMTAMYGRFSVDWHKINVDCWPKSFRSNQLS